MPSKLSEARAFTRTRSSQIWAMRHRHQPLGARVQVDLQVADQLFGRVDPDVRDPADDLKVACLHRQPARVTPGRDDKPSARAIGTILLWPWPSSSGSSRRGTQEAGPTPSSIGLPVGAWGKPSDTAVRASARSLRRCAASFSAEGTVTVALAMRQAEGLGLGHREGALVRGRQAVLGFKRIAFAHVFGLQIVDQHGEEAPEAARSPG